MSIAYITKQGSYLRKNQGRLHVYHEDTLISELIIQELEQIVLMGHINITTKAMISLMNDGIDIAFMSLYGKLKGRMCSENPKNVFLRFAQYDIYNSDLRFEYAKAIVKGKISNQKSFIAKQMQTNEHDAKFANILEKLNASSRIEQLMGHEGIASREYFSLLSKTIKDMDFNKRVTRPAFDPVNAMLNLGYTMLTNEISSLMEIAGFETEAGFLHGLRYGRSTLALDFIEAYRSYGIDSLILHMVNERIVSSDDFKITNLGCRFKDVSIPIFFKEYARHMNENKIRSIIRNEIINLKKSVLKKEPYTPYSFNESE